MDKRVIFAVAGSGKTTQLIASLNLTKRFLILSYTDNNVQTLKKKIVEKFGYFPSNISVFSYFVFVHSFCYKPFLLYELRTRGLQFKPNPNRYLAQTELAYFIDKGKRVYHNRLAKLIAYKGLLPEVSARVAKYFDVVCVDEVQDIGGHDFDLMLALCSGNIDCLLVGDYFQHTYVSSQDGSANKNLHADYEKYKKRFKKAGITVDTTSLLKSRRCSKTTCDFINTQMGILIESHAELVTEVQYIADQAVADALFARNDVIKLFYKEHFLYNCFSQNWGVSKGQDHYQDACVVLNDTTHDVYKTGSLLALKTDTKNKLYVACFRARGNLYLVPQKLYKKYRGADA